MNRLYNLTIPIIGITGGIASGKSSFSKLIADLGELVICADNIVKEIYSKSETKKYIKEIAPVAIDQSGEINFKKLRELFFNNNQIKINIEQFIHPKIEPYFKEKILKNHQRVFYDVPLLFEKKMESNFDHIVLVKVNEEIQLQRLINRDHITEDLAKKIIKNQLHFTEKEKMSNFIVENNLGLPELKQEALNILKKITTLN